MQTKFFYSLQEFLEIIYSDRKRRTSVTRCSGKPRFWVNRKQLRKCITDSLKGKLLGRPQFREKERCLVGNVPSPSAVALIYMQGQDYA